MKSISRCLGLTLLLFLLPLGPAWADGMSFKYRDWSDLQPMAEEQQIAAIRHENGRERMLLAINIKPATDESAVWIVPVPGQLDEIEVDITEEFPHFRGKSATYAAEMHLMETVFCLQASQIYPVAIFCLVVPNFLGAGGLNIEVGAQADQYGIHSEIVAASSVADLAGYIHEQGLEMSEEQLASFTDYFDGRHCFALTWVTSWEELVADYPELEGDYRWRTPCLDLRFPVEQPFYPLKPTQAYGAVEVPFRLLVLDHVKPMGTDALLRELDVEHYELDLRTGLDHEFVEGFSGLIPYTRITYSGPAELFTEDLVFESTIPASVAYGNMLLTLPSAVWALIVGGLLSYLCGGLAGLALFRRWSFFALFGLWNLTTILGLYVATRRWKRSGSEELRRVQRIAGVHFSYIGLFSVLFVLSSLLVYYIAKLPLG